MEASFGSVLDVQKETDPIRGNIMVWICVAGDILQITIQLQHCHYNIKDIGKYTLECIVY